MTTTLPRGAEPGTPTIEIDFRRTTVIAAVYDAPAFTPIAGPRIRPESIIVDWVFDTDDWYLEMARVTGTKYKANGKLGVQMDTVTIWDLNPVVAPSWLRDLIRLTGPNIS